MKLVGSSECWQRLTFLTTKRAAQLSFSPKLIQFTNVLMLQCEKALSTYKVKFLFFLWFKCSFSCRLYTTFKWRTGRHLTKRFSRFFRSEVSSICGLCLKSRGPNWQTTKCLSRSTENAAGTWNEDSKRSVSDRFPPTCRRSTAFLKNDTANCSFNGRRRPTRILLTGGEGGAELNPKAKILIFV